jgi:hypothetical protein
MQLPSMTRARLGIAAVAAVPAIALAGCGTADQSDLQNKIKDGLNKNAPAGVSVTSVSCPGDVKLKKGTAFNCTVTFTANGASRTATYAGAIVDDKNDFSGHLVNSSGGSSGTTTPATTTT